VARQKQHDAIDLQIALAWQIEAFHRTKKLRDLKSILAKRDPSGKPKSQTPQEMRNVLQALGMKSRPMSEDTKKAVKFIRIQ